MSHDSSFPFCKWIETILGRQNFRLIAFAYRFQPHTSIVAPLRNHHKTVCRYSGSSIFWMRELMLPVDVAWTPQIWNLWPSNGTTSLIIQSTWLIVMMSKMPNKSRRCIVKLLNCSTTSACPDFRNSANVLLVGDAITKTIPWRLCNGLDRMPNVGHWLRNNVSATSQIAFRAVWIFRSPSFLSAVYRLVYCCHARRFCFRPYKRAVELFCK